MRTDFALSKARTLERLCSVVQLRPYAISDRNCFDMCRHLMNINEQCGISQLILSDRYFNRYDPYKHQCANAQGGSPYSVQCPIILADAECGAKVIVCSAHKLSITIQHTNSFSKFLKNDLNINF